MPIILIDQSEKPIIITGTEWAFVAQVKKLAVNDNGLEVKQNLFTCTLKSTGGVFMYPHGDIHSWE